jgi:hypothetical protein
MVKAAESMAEGKRLFDAILIPFVNELGAAQVAAALGALALAEVPATGAGAQDLAGRCDFKALGHRLFRFDTFGTSHNSIFR